MGYTGILKAAARAIEYTYTGTCTVTEFAETLDSVTHITRTEPTVTLKGQPCRLSHASAGQAVQGATSTSKDQVIKLFLSPELTVKPGSEVEVTQDGVTTKFRASGEPAVFPTHQEVVLELADRWA